MGDAGEMRVAGSLCTRLAGNRALHASTDPPPFHLPAGVIAIPALARGMGCSQHAIRQPASSQRAAAGWKGWPTGIAAWGDWRDLATQLHHRWFHTSRNLRAGTDAPPTRQAILCSAIYRGIEALSSRRILYTSTGTRCDAGLDPSCTCGL
jgi:hypothetical protein